jgi:hypothetical protein
VEFALTVPFILLLLGPDKWIGYLGLNNLSSNGRGRLFRIVRGAGSTRELDRTRRF